MNDFEQEQRRNIIPCCVHLRTKTMYCVPAEMTAGPGHVKVTGTGAYWCDCTQELFGPDDCVAGPHECQPGRECYKPAD